MEKRIKNKIKYFVSYCFSYKDGVCGFGNCEVWQDDGRFDIANVQRKIEEDNKDFKKGSVIILYFKKLEKGESF